MKIPVKVYETPGSIFRDSITALKKMDARVRNREAYIFCPQCQGDLPHTDEKSAYGCGWQHSHNWYLVSTWVDGKPVKYK